MTFNTKTDFQMIGRWGCSILFAACIAGAVGAKAQSGAPGVSQPGVIYNRADEGLYPALREAVAKDCGVGAAGHAINRFATTALVQAIKRTSGAMTIRVLRDGAPTTREYIPRRLNLIVDGRNRVIRVRCG